jgi:Rps23 Pro-64 3,4-dihydroxylase Tpa1-like proline 4-hydroxylase
VTVFTPFHFDPRELERLGAARHQEYISAQPFEHAVFDELVPDAVLEAVLEDFPAPGEDAWISYESENERKLASTHETRIGEATVQLISELNSSTFINFLEQLTGITGLVPDPHLVGGGLHQIVPGGHLGVHVDFNRHPRTGLERRLNVLLYLNRDWEEEYGGALELWRADPRRCERQILPIGGRVVVFSTTARSYHGHPKPLACPEGMTRKSLALYYYSLAPEARNGHGSAAHNTLFMPEQQSRTKRAVRALTPPALVDLARSARRRQRSQA